MNISIVTSAQAKAAVTPDAALSQTTFDLGLSARVQRHTTADIVYSLSLEDSADDILLDDFDTAMTKKIGAGSPVAQDSATGEAVAFTGSIDGIMIRGRQSGSAAATGSYTVTITNILGAANVATFDVDSTTEILLHNPENWNVSATSTILIEENTPSGLILELVIYGNTESGY